MWSIKSGLPIPQEPFPRIIALAIALYGMMWLINPISSKPRATHSVGLTVFRFNMRKYWSLFLVLTRSAYANTNDTYLGSELTQHPYQMQTDGGGYGNPKTTTTSSGYNAPPPTYGAYPPGTVTLTSTKTIISSEYCAIPPPATVTHVISATTTKTITSSEYCAIPPQVTVTHVENFTTTKACVFRKSR